MQMVDEVDKKRVLQLRRVDSSNFEKALWIQSEIFPEENGTINILASVDRKVLTDKLAIDYIDDGIKYYLVGLNGKDVGIVGLYNYKNVAGVEFENDCWLGWFGILPKFRGNGLGEEALKEIISVAVEDGFEMMRLYTDIEESPEAKKLYEKMGFVGEAYTAEQLGYDCYIYTKGLAGRPVKKWENRWLGLEDQTIRFEKMSKRQTDEILRRFVEFTR